MGIAYGPWRVEEVARGVVPYEGYEGTFKPTAPCFMVRDLNGQSLIACATREMAELIASLPDLCDTDLRPVFGGSDTMSFTVTLPDQCKTPEQMGVVDVSGAFEYGRSIGYTQGYDVGFDESLGVENDCPACIDRAVDDNG